MVAWSGGKHSFLDELGSYPCLWQCNKTFFGGNLDFPKIKNLKASVFWCMNMHKNAIFKQNYSTIFVLLLKWPIFTVSDKVNFSFSRFPPKQFITSNTGQIIVTVLTKFTVYNFIKIDYSCELYLSQEHTSSFLLNNKECTMS